MEARLAHQLSLQNIDLARAAGSIGHDVHLNSDRSNRNGASRPSAGERRSYARPPCRTLRNEQHIDVDAAYRPRTADLFQEYYTKVFVIRFDRLAD